MATGGGNSGVSPVPIEWALAWVGQMHPCLLIRKSLVREEAQGSVIRFACFVRMVSCP
jgi:hypothetical protein